MCVDFRDLNKLGPNDCYPLHRIDESVYATCDYEILSFIDAYSDYNQITMCKKGASHIVFYANSDIYQYTVMHFVLINAGANY